jgi:hypothetical protein
MYMSTDAFQASDLLRFEHDPGRHRLSVGRGKLQ